MTRSTKTKTIAAIAVALLLAYGGYEWYGGEEPIYPGAPGDSWCNNDYAKRIDINVNNTAGSALTDYQVYVNLSANPINETSLRVYNTTSCTLRPHWTENETSGNSYGVWINYSAIAASAWTNNTAIYYYNATASSANNITTTFMFGEDFTGIIAKSLTHNSTNRQADNPTWHIDYVNACDVIGNYAYCAAMDSGTLTILDISNPASVSEAGHTACSSAHDIRVIGDIAYVVGYTSHTLYTFNICNPSSITSLDSINVGGTRGMYLYVEGNYAYVTVWDSGNLANNCMKIYDISNPSDILAKGTICGATAHLDKPWHVEKKNDYLYITTQDSPYDGISIINVSDVNSPTYAGGIYGDSLKYFSLDLRIKGNYIFTGSWGGDISGTYDLLVYDISTPTTLNLISQTPNLFGQHLDISGDFLYARGGDPLSMDDGITVSNIADPYNPYKVGGIYGAGSPYYLDACHWIQVVGDKLYTFGYHADAFVILNIVDTTTLDIGKWDGDTGNTLISNGIVTLSGDEKYIHGKTNNSLPFVMETRAKVSNDEIADALIGTGDEMPTGSYEDFTGYTEVDPNSHITVTTNKLTGTGLARNEDAYVYKDFGMDNFDVLDIQFEMHATSGDSASYIEYFCLANVVNDAQEFGTTDLSVELTVYSPNYFRLVRGQYVAFDTWTGASVDTTYYCTLKRTAGSDTVELEVRTGSHTGTLQTTLSVSGFGTTKWRYLYGMNSKNSSSSETQNGWTQNICLSSPCAAADAAPKNGTLYRTVTGTDKIYTRTSESWNDKGTVSADLDAYQTRKFVMTDSNVKAYYDNILDKEVTTNVPTANMNAWYQSKTSSDVLVDWVFARKYASPEPSSTLGSEEDQPAGGTTPVISNVQNGSINSTAQYIDWDVNQTAHNQVVYDKGYVGAGSTACEGQWSATHACTNASDGNWSSYAESAGTLLAYAYFNYTVPTGASQSESLWHVKDSPGHANLTIPSACWGGTLYLRAMGNDIGNSITWQCDNGPGWTTLRTSVANIAYEQEMKFKYVSSWDNSTAAPNITLSGLIASTLYEYQAWSYNTSNTSLSDNSSTLNFTTAAGVGIIVKQWIDVSSYNNTHVIYNLTTWVYNNYTSSLNVSVDVDVNWTDYNINNLAPSASDIHTQSATFVRPLSDANFTAAAAILGDEGAGTSNALVVFLPVDPPSKAAGANDITILAGNRALFCNWSEDQTFQQMQSNLTNTTDYFWYNSTSQKWTFYNVSRTINQDTLVDKHNAVIIYFNKTTTVECNILSAETITVPSNVWYYTALRESTSKTLTEINTAITADGCTINDLYAWNSTAGSYTDTGSYIVLPNEGFAIYATAGCPWDGSI